MCTRTKVAELVTYANSVLVGFIGCRLPKALMASLCGRCCHILLHTSLTAGQFTWSCISGMTNYHLDEWWRQQKKRRTRWHRRCTVTAATARRRDVFCYCCCLRCPFVFPSSFHLIWLHHVVNISTCSVLPYNWWSWLLTSPSVCVIGRLRHLFIFDIILSIIMVHCGNWSYSAWSANRRWSLLALFALWRACS